MLCVVPVWRAPPVQGQAGSSRTRTVVFSAVMVPVMHRDHPRPPAIPPWPSLRVLTKPSWGSGSLRPCPFPGGAVPVLIPPSGGRTFPKIHPKHSLGPLPVPDRQGHGLLLVTGGFLLLEIASSFSPGQDLVFTLS